ncbi:hypothetical protein ACRCUN_07575 [Mycobacterium sp. LTG2003]
MPARSLALLSADLDQLVAEVGAATLVLTVPVLDGAIQVGIGGDYPTGTIAVTTTACGVQVRHADGRPMQVHIVRDWQGADSPGIRSALFGEPVDELTLERRGRSWVTCAGLPVLGVDDLAAFVNTVARFAAAKRRKARQVVAA